MTHPPDLAGKDTHRESEGNLSPFATVVAFDPVLPLARVPVPAGQGDDPAKGPYVLAFRNEEAWRRAWRRCKENIASQCEAGSKLACSITATKACARPWWHPFSGSGDREECEEREMRGCVASAQERCAWYARETCDPVYANMRIAAPGAPIDRRFDGQPLRRPRVTRHDKLKLAAMTDCPDAAPVDEDEERPSLGVTTFRGRLLMQHERQDEWERMPVHWSAQGLSSASVRQEFPKEGWVGGLVHPAPRTSPAHDLQDSASTKHPLFPALQWLQQLQQSVMSRFGL